MVNLMDQSGMLTSLARKGCEHRPTDFVTTGRVGGVLRRAEALAGCVAVAFLATGNSAGEPPTAPEPTAIDRYLPDSLDAIRSRYGGRDHPWW